MKKLILASSIALACLAGASSSFAQDRTSIGRADIPSSKLVPADPADSNEGVLPFLLHGAPIVISDKPSLPLDIPLIPLEPAEHHG